MNYIDFEKLKTDLESLYDNMLKRIKIDEDNSDYWAGKADAYRNVIDTIDSLQQEQPDNEDIDKVAQELYEHLYELKRRNNVPTNLYDKQEIIDLWKAGIEYAYNHPKQEQSEGGCSEKPNNHAEWSEEDVKKINSIIFKLQHDGGIIYEKEITFLKSLRPQPRWKPSDEQMLALGGVLDYLDESDNEDADIVRELINDLQNL